MAITPITVATGTGALVAAVATAGLCLSIVTGDAPQQSLIGLLVAGVVILVAVFVRCFEEQARLQAIQTDRWLQARRHAAHLARAAPAPSPRTHASKK